MGCMATNEECSHFTFTFDGKDQRQTRKLSVNKAEVWERLHGCETYYPHVTVLDRLLSSKLGKLVHRNNTNFYARTKFWHK